MMCLFIHNIGVNCCNNAKDVVLYMLIQRNVLKRTMGKNMKRLDKLVIPKTLTMTTIDDLYCSVLNLHDLDCVLLDLSNVEFVTPQGLMLLVTLSRFINEKYGYYTIWCKAKAKIISYLDRMNMNKLDFIRIDHQYSSATANQRESDALVEFTEIKNAEHLGKAIVQTKNVLRHWFPDSQGTHEKHISTLIMETVENSIEHSSAKPSEGSCYYVLQKYQYRDGNVEVQIAVGDMGIGMLASQRQKYPSTKDDLEAIKEAFLYGRSGRLSGGGGMGYASVREALGPLKGRVAIRSGKAHIEYQAGMNGVKIYRHGFSYPGTQIFFACST